jgi:protein TonB
MNPHSDIAWPKELGRQARRQRMLWLASAAVIFAAHAGAAYIVTREPPTPPIQEAGAGAIEIDIAALGFAPADQVASGVESEAVEPTTAEAVEPVETSEPAEPVETAAVEPQESEPVEPTDPTEAEVTPPETAEPVEAVEPVESEPVEAAPAEVPVEAAQPVEEREELAAVVDVPIPTPRPAYTPPPEPQRTERPRQQQQAARPAPRQGSGGQNQADAQRGVAEGSAAARAAPSGQARQANAAGNAAVSNYPGQIASRLRRSLRYPREAQRQGIRGEVHVQFTVNAGGGVGGVSIARSSGSPVLDQAALQTVQRAAPFPAIPPAAGRNSWPFTVPLVFSR